MPVLGAEEGRGIALMHALMDRVRFRPGLGQGMIVHLVKQLEFDDEPRAERLLLAPPTRDEDRTIPPPPAPREQSEQTGKHRRSHR